MLEKIGFSFLFLIISMIAIFEPTTTMASNTKMPMLVIGGVVSGNPDVEIDYIGDNELNRSGAEIREEIDVDSKELDTHGIKDIEKGKGGFYKAYQEEFDELADTVPGAEGYVELMERYDYHAGNFDCKKLDINCHITNFMYVTGSSVINFIVSPLKKLAIEPEKIIDDSVLEKFKNNFNTFTNSLLAVFILFQVMKIYVFRFSNHMDTVGVVNEKIIRVFFAGVLLFSYDLFFNLILQVQYRVNYGIFSYLGNTKEVTSNLMLNLTVTPVGLMFVMFVLAFAVLLAILFFQMTYTFALIGLFFVVGPVAVVTMVNDEYNMFSMWLKTIVARFLTLALQGLCVILCFSFGSKIEWIFNGFDSANDAFGKILALSFLIVGITLPGLLKEFGNSSGSGRGAVSGVQSVTRTVTKK